MVVDEPLHPAFEAWQFLNDVWLQRFHRQEGNQTDHRPDLQGTAGVIRQLQHIVEKAILIVPQGMPTEVIHGVGNVHEVLEKFARDVFIGMIVPRQLERNS